MGEGDWFSTTSSINRLEVAIAMQCPYCSNEKTKVIDSRETDRKVRRRRECSSCEKRFTTYETVERFDVKVKKRNGETQDFNQEKIREGIAKAVKKTSASDQVEEIVEEVKTSILGNEEVTAEEIGEAVKKSLKKRDEVAYMRFASVYDSFEDAESFKQEAEALRDSK